jgi:glycosyltransferase involved in cell wall biosynthesis
MPQWPDTLSDMNETQPNAAREDDIRLSVVIPAYNEESYLAGCLEAVLAELAANSDRGSFELIVVDNGSADQTAAIAGRFPGVKVVNEPYKGLTRARQRGLQEAQGAILAYVDADTRMPGGWVRRVLDKFNDDQVVCVSGPYVYHDITRTKAALVRMYWRLIAAPAYWLTGYMAVGGNFAARADALAKIGGFDTTISFYGEDTNIARRLANVGCVVFDKNLMMLTSARRLHAEGFVRTALRYAMNFATEATYGRPFTTRYRDIR